MNSSFRIWTIQHTQHKSIEGTNLCTILALCLVLNKAFTKYKFYTSLFTIQLEVRTSGRQVLWESLTKADIKNDLSVLEARTWPNPTVKGLTGKAPARFILHPFWHQHTKCTSASASTVLELLQCAKPNKSHMQSLATGLSCWWMLVILVALSCWFNKLLTFYKETYYIFTSTE